MITEAIILFAVVAIAIIAALVQSRLRRSRKTKGWVIGPILPSGKNTSQGYPERPETGDGYECAFDFAPGAANHVHYLTKDRGPIVGKSLFIEYNILADDTTKFFSQEGDGLAWITPFIQREGDDFTANGDMTYYRWWSNKFTQTITPGKVSITIPLDPSYWRHTMGDTGDSFWVELLANPGRIGITFGGPTGLGHGVYSTGPARFVLNKLQILP